MKFTFKKIQDSIKHLALVISRGIKKFSLFKIVTDKYTLTVHQIPLPLFLLLLSNIVPNDVNTTIINIKTKHYPFLHLPNV